MSTRHREGLISSAQALKPPTSTGLLEYSNKREEMAAQVNQELAARPDLEKLVGTDGKRMGEDNNRNFSMFMESILDSFQAETFVDTALWAFRTYRSHGFHVSYWPANLNIWVEVLNKNLSQETYHEIAPFYKWLITHIPAFAELTDSFVTS